VRGADVFQECPFTTVRLESFVPADHPLRPIKEALNEAMKSLNRLFSSIYCDTGRESIPPERLIRAQWLQVLFSIRSERQLAEQINYHLRYRWFVGLTMDDSVWNRSTFSINRDRLLKNDVITERFEEVAGLARKRKLLSDEHFSVDGTLIQAWASQKSYRRKDNDSEPPAGGGRNSEANLHGEKRSNATHGSKTDGDARMARKGPGKEARRSYMGHPVMENRNGLIVKAAASPATGKAEREVAADLLAELPGMKKRTVGADKNHDSAGFVEACRAINITPHVARNDNRTGGSAIDGRTSRHAGYPISQRSRKRVEEPFGRGKSVGLIRPMKVRGLSKVRSVFMLTMIGWNLTRMRALEG